MAVSLQPSLAQSINIPTFWLVICLLLGGGTVVLIVLLRTKLRGAKTWHKCAMLSLWVHVLIACVTAAVQIASSGPGEGAGYGPPIQVALLPDQIATATALSTLPAATVVAPADVEPEEQPEAKAQEPADEVEEPAESPVDTPDESAAPEAFDAPDLLEEPEPSAPEPSEPQPLEPEPAVEEEAPVDPLTQPSPKLTAAPVDVSAPIEDQPASEPATPPSNGESFDPFDEGTLPATTAAAPRELVAPAPALPQSPAAFAGRFAANREQLVASGGGGAQTERAVRAALGWLAAAQSEDGRWDAKRHGAGQERFVLNQDRGGAGAKADSGVTGLALLTFLGAGHSHRQGPYAVNVGEGLRFLRRSQHANGNLYGDAELFAQMYCHSMATFAVSEAYALTQDERLEAVVRAASNYSLAVQHPTDGGWRYRPGDTGDTSQLGWQVMALRSAELGGMPMPAVTWTRVERFLRQVERGQHGGLAVYRPEEARPTRSMTAEALYCRQLVTGRANGGLSTAALQEAITTLAAEPPSTKGINLYYWYYATLALHRAQHTSATAADAWRRWNDSLTQTLLATQQADGCWPETCVWGGYGGRVYTTSLAAMCLEVYYRYAPPDEPAGPHDPADVARRNGWQGASPR